MKNLAKYGFCAAAVAAMALSPTLDASSAHASTVKEPRYGCKISWTIAKGKYKYTNNQGKSVEMSVDEVAGRRGTSPKRFYVSDLTKVKKEVNENNRIFGQNSHHLTCAPLS